MTTCMNGLVSDQPSEETKGLIEMTLSRLIQSVAAEGNHNTEYENDEPFFVADMGEIYRQHRRWKKCLPRVTPFYGTPSPRLRFYQSLMYVSGQVQPGQRSPQAFGFTRDGV